MERKQFYKNLKSFLKELIVVFPEDDEDLQTVTTYINLAIVDDDNNEIIKKFYTAFYSVERELINRDNTIFDKINWESSSYEYQLFVKLNSNWNTFSENNKSVIWDYITLLYKLSKII